MRTSGTQFSNEKTLVCGFELRLRHTLREFVPGPIMLIPLVYNSLHITYMIRRNTKLDFLLGAVRFSDVSVNFYQTTRRYAQKTVITEKFIKNSKNCDGPERSHLALNYDMLYWFVTWMLQVTRLVNCGANN